MHLQETGGAGRDCRHLRANVRIKHNGVVEELFAPDSELFEDLAKACRSTPPHPSTLK